MNFIFLIQLEKMIPNDFRGVETTNLMMSKGPGVVVVFIPELAMAVEFGMT